MILPIGSLGGLFRRRVSDFPGKAYLKPRPAVVRRWADRLGPRSGAIRVGLSWRGGSPQTRSGARSVSLRQLAPILDLPGCDVFSLQYGDVAGELAGVSVTSFDAAEIDDFEDLAGLIANLDVVVSVQTALVHLCGGLGAHCLALLPQHAEWRYGNQGSTMPWYGSVRLFRQRSAGDWEPVIREVAAALALRLHAAKT